jgi:hypothetical protein
MLNDTNAACVAIALVMCLKSKRNFSAKPMNGTKKDRNTYTKFL